LLGDALSLRWLKEAMLWRQVLKYELQETRKSQESFRDLYVRQRRENEDLKVINSSLGAIRGG
jgi:hypothetical protein